MFKLIAILFTMILLACEPVPTETPPTSTPTPTLQVSEEVQQMAVDTIGQYDLVREAAIKQEGTDLSLVITVDYATNEEYAKELGDNFVRLVKSFSQDESPGQTIGSGIFGYLVGVYYPNGEQVALGAKVRSADRITW